MRNMLKVQLIQMFHKKGFQLSFAVMMIYVLYSYLYHVFKYKNYELSEMITAEALFSLHATTDTYYYFALIFPFIVAFPFAFSFLTDKQIKIQPILQVKSGVKNYYVTKTIACFIGGFLIIFIPLIVSLALTKLTFPTSGLTAYDSWYELNFFMRMSGDYSELSSLYPAEELATQVGVPFAWLYLYSPVLYNFFYACIASLFAGFASVFIFSTSFYVNRFKILILVPFYVFLVILDKLNNILSEANILITTSAIQYISADAGGFLYSFVIWLIVLFLALFSFLSISRQIRIDQL